MALIQVTLIAGVSDGAEKGNAHREADRRHGQRRAKRWGPSHGDIVDSSFRVPTARTGVAPVARGRAHTFVSSTGSDGE
jgi:hypothetical protein